MKKSKWLKILEWVISYTPIIIWLIYNQDKFISTEPRVATSIILFIGAIALLFVKDLSKNLMDWIKSPTPFKFSLIIWVLSALALLYGRTFFEVSSVTTLSFLIAFPIASWSEKQKSKESGDDIIDKLRKVMKD